MGFYGKTRKTASRLLGKFGGKVTFKRTTKGDYNPATGRYADEQEITWETNAVQTGITEQNFSGFGGVMTGGSRIEVGDMMLLVDLGRQANTPQVGDKVVLNNGEEWVVVQGVPVQPGSEDVLYKGIIRKG